MKQSFCLQYYYYKYLLFVIISEPTGPQEDFAVVTVDDSDIRVAANTEDCAAFSVNAGKIDNKANSNFVCCCKFNKNQPCSLLFLLDEIKDLRESHQALEKEELDLVILAQIQSGIRDGPMTERPRQKEQTERKRVRVEYRYKGAQICRDTFMFIHGIFKDRLTNLIQHYQQNGVTSRTHGNTKRTLHNALTYEQRVNVVRFIQNYAEEHAILLPGRIPGYSRTDLKLLPSSCTKAAVHLAYTESCRAGNIRAVAQRMFYQLWQSCLPEILPMKPSTDLCWTCQRNSTLISRKSNVPEEEKLDILNKAREHVNHASAEREEYNRIKQLAKVSVGLLVYGLISF